MMLLDPGVARSVVDALALGLLATGLISTLLQRLSSFITLLAVQGILLSGAAATVALSSGDLHAYVALAGTVGVKAIGVPLVLTIALHRVRQRRDGDAVISHRLAFVAAVGLTLLAYVVAGPIARADAQLTLNVLPAAVALLLLGLFTMATRGSALTQVVGLVMSENGIYLAAVAVTRGLPLAVELGVAVDVLIGVLVMGLVTRHIERTFETIDTERLRALRG
jgi:hydrogenase-4 membrane subunit HyfE